VVTIERIGMTEDENESAIDVQQALTIEYITEPTNRAANTQGDPDQSTVVQDPDMVMDINTTTEVN
jgi:hypothetical protein